jgi:hypothetical protein
MHQAAELHTLPGLPAPCGWGERSEVTVFSRYKLMLKVNVLLRNNQLSISDYNPSQPNNYLLSHTSVRSAHEWLLD